MLTYAWAGWVASSFMFGQFLSSFAWGMISDRVAPNPLTNLILIRPQSKPITAIQFILNLRPIHP